MVSGALCHCTMFSSSSCSSRVSEPQRRGLPALLSPTALPGLPRTNLPDRSDVSSAYNDNKQPFKRYAWHSEGGCGCGSGRGGVLVTWRTGKGVLIKWLIKAGGGSGAQYNTVRLLLSNMAAQRWLWLHNIKKKNNDSKYRANTLYQVNMTFDVPQIV